MGTEQFECGPPYLVPGNQLHYIVNCSKSCLHEFGCFQTMMTLLMLQAIRPSVQALYGEQRL
jgi:Holliday junction resolvasome RuvABC DNA-binding subunit